jgi:CheY-like chemotaxis protein
MRALVVDDSPMLRLILRKMLQGLGAEVLEVGDGRMALSHLREVGPPDVLFLDWSMPEMDGFAVLQKIRARAEWNALRIVMVSGEEQASSIDKAMAAGADAYLVKPFKAEDLREKLVALKLMI